MKRNMVRVSLAVLTALGLGCGSDNPVGEDARDSAVREDGPSCRLCLPAPDFGSDASATQPDIATSPSDVAKADAPTVDVQPGSSDSAVDLGTLADVSTSGFPCRNDDDCCVTIDGCMATAYLYSKGPGATPAPTFSHPEGTLCLACIPPAIELRCVSGQCVGERISSYSGSLLSDHCGYIPVSDGGMYALHNDIDGGSPATTKTVWTCSGG